MYHVWPQSWPEWARRILPCARRFNVAGRAHDAWYERWGTERDRLRADTLFLYLMLCVSKNPWHVFVARTYYALVRLFGWAFFQYRETCAKPINGKFVKNS